jgi:Putative Ig domain
MLRLLLSVVLYSLVTACGGGGGGGGDGSSPKVTPPSSLSYNGGTAVVAVVGTAITTLNPTVVGAVTSYAVSPSLPAGLTLSTSSGAISGTPTAVTAQATYTVTASNTGGHATFGLQLTVDPAAPSGLSYNGGATVIAVQDHVIAPLIPTVTGTVTNYSVNPLLPAGLFLDPVSGVISGTPRAAVSGTYAIGASNVTGITAFDLTLNISAAPTSEVGILRGSVIEGVSYHALNGPLGEPSGLTLANGHFDFAVGDGVVFGIGPVALGTVPLAGRLLTSIDLRPGSNPGHPAVNSDALNLERFLMMLDTNNDTTDGLQISSSVSAAATTNAWNPTFTLDAAMFASSLATIVTQASAADGVTHVLPDQPTAQAHLTQTFLCAYSGGFIGSYVETGGAGDHGRFAAEVSPDGSIEVIGYSSVDAVNQGFDGLQDAAVTTSAVSLLLDKSFSVTDSPTAATGQFLDADNLSGNWTVTGVGAATGTFTGARLPAADSAKYRFTGDFEDQSAPDFVLGMLALDWDGTANANAVKGYVFRFDNGHLASVTGTIDVANVFTGTIDEPTPIAISGTYTPGSLHLDSHYTQGTSTIELVSDGCRLN